MDSTSESHDAFADLNPLPSVYMSDGPVSVSLESLFSMDQDPSMPFSPDMGLPHFPINPSLIQKPDHPTSMPTFRLPILEGLALPPARGPRTKRKPLSEKPVQFPPAVPVTATKPQKAHVEILDSVRSKLRESLASALAVSAGEKPVSPPLTKSADDEAAGPCPRDDLLQENGLSWASADRSRALAADVETELFRLFGGVNKKYKEKARSLLFNLKDPSNPELRKRVVSGEITAQRLCTMSAEELASKELSEWRMAKAEELGKMVVLQDADVDPRRMVKKTHKGEVVLEVDDAGASAEVSVGANSLPLIMPKAKNIAPEKKQEEPVPLITPKAKVISPEKKQEEPVPPPESSSTGPVALELPPVVSPDEFRMPPVLSPIRSASPVAKTDERHVWEGVIQLTLSSLTTVVALFRSGERAATKEWPTIVEVKGRVRVEAFEKFFRDLPLSKSRGIMVLDLQWKEDSSEAGRRALSEVVESYESDGRLGYAEPCPGVELYLCPAGGKTAKMVAGDGDVGDDIGNMIGIVVWRRAMESPKVHNSKQSLAKRSSLSKKQSRPVVTHEVPPDDDVPPGFGPGTVVRAIEDDDLPEFDFRGTTTTTVMAPPPGYHTRDLIQKYGVQRGVKRPWEDDDDIPEWKPHQAIVAAPQQTMMAALPQPAVAMVPPPWGFAAGDQRSVMDWRYRMNRSQGF